MLGNKKSILALVGAITLCTTSFSGPVIQSGIGFFVSPKGQEYFKTNLETVLLNNQVDLRTMDFDPTDFTLDDPFNSDNMPASVRNTRGSQIQRISKTLGVFFKGIPIFNPVFKFSMSPYSTKTKFKSMGVEIDPKGLATYKKKKGVVLLMRLEGSDFLFKLAKLNVVDTKNPDFLGVMGADGVEARLTDGVARPIRVEIPIWVDTTEKGLKIQALTIRSNIQKTVFAADFKSLRLPVIEIIVNGKKYAMDKLEFEKEVRRMMPDILDLVASGVKNFFEKSGGPLLQEKFDSLAKSLNTSFEMAIPDAPAGTAPMTLAIQPTDIRAAKDLLQLTFKTELKDPSLPAPGLFQVDGTAGIPAMATKPSNEYDVAISLHPGIINGILRRSFERGFMDTLDIGESKPAEMTKPLIFQFDSSLGMNYARIHVAIKYDVRGFESLFFTRDMPMEFDLKAKIETNNKGEMELVAVEVIEDTIKIDKKAAWLFRGKAERRATAKLVAKKDDYAKNRKVLGTIPGMADLFGIPLRLLDAQTDGGTVVMFSNFDPK